MKAHKKFYAKVENPTSCGTCRALHSGGIKDKKPCSDLGMLPTSKPCRKYTADHRLAHKESEISMHLFAAIAKASPQLREYIAYQLICANRIDRWAAPFEFMQKLYLRWQGRGNYISNFCRCYLLDANRDCLVLIGESGRTVYTIERGLVKQGKIMSEAKFSPLRDVMVEKGRVFDPFLATQHRRVVAIDPEEIPTIDTVAEHEQKLDNDLLYQSDIGELLREIGETGTAQRTYQKIKRKQALTKAAEEKGLEYEELDGVRHYKLGRA